MVPNKIMVQTQINRGFNYANTLKHLDDVLLKYQKHESGL